LTGSRNRWFRPSARNGGQVAAANQAEVPMTQGVRRSRLLLLAVVAALVAALVATSIGSAAQTAAPVSPIAGVLKQVKGMKVKDREAKLAALAAQEGQVSLYTSLSRLVVDPLSKAWASAYPNIKLTIYRASSEDVTARFLSESSAGTKGADVVETNGSTMLIFQHKRTLLVPYRGSPFAVQIPKQYRFDSFTGDRVEKFVVAWNTRLVSDPPRTFRDLADPKWKGKLSMEPTDSDWYAAIYTYFTTVAKPRMTKSAVDALFKKIAANSQLINGHTNQATALAAGQVQVVVTGHAQAMEQLQASKAPIAFQPFVLPVIERPQGIGISYLSQHPAGALLFYDWLLSGQGQKVLQSNGVEPANPYFPDNAFSTRPKTYVMDLRPIVAHWAEWQKHYESVTRG
jgi:iron(III) transport system substrate-binding protein